MANPSDVKETSSISGQKIDIRVYVEGHLIPCHGLSLSFYDGQPSQGTIMTTPSDSAKKIPKFSSVAIFYYDNNFKEWCLLWEGLYIGWQFSKTALSRGIALSVMDWNILLKRATFLQVGNGQDLLNTSSKIYAQGNTTAVLFGTDNGKAAPGLDEVLSESNKANNELQQIKSISKAAGIFLFAPRNFMDFNFIAKNIISQEGMGVKDFCDIARKTIEAVLWLNPLVFHRYINSRMRNKYVSMPDTNFIELMTAETIQQMLGNTSVMRQDNTAYDAISTFLMEAMYYMAPVSAPPFNRVEEADTVFTIPGTEITTISRNTGVDYKINSYIYHPQIFFNVPPTCNILFPEHIKTINYSSNALEAPTRLLMEVNPLIFGDSGIKAGYYFSDMGEYVNSEKMLQDMKGLPLNMFMSAYSPDDYERYPQAAYMQLSNSMYLATVLKTKETEQDKKLQQNMCRLAQYMYLKKKYERRPLDIVGCFNPYFCVAFPGVVLDNSTSFMAKPLSVTHSISAGGDATTSYMFEFAVELDKDDLLPETKTLKHTKFPLLPKWAPESYMPDKIDETYSKILGANYHKNKHSALSGIGTTRAFPGADTAKELVSPGVVDKDSGTTETKVNISKLVDCIFSLNREKPSGQYDTAEDKLLFAKRYTARPVTTFDQYCQFYSMEAKAQDGRLPEKLPSNNGMFNHIVNIQSKKTGNMLFVDTNLAKTVNNVDDLINKQTSTDPTNTTVDAITDNFRYKIMDAIQEDLKRTAFRG